MVAIITFLSDTQSWRLLTVTFTFPCTRQKRGQRSVTVSFVELDEGLLLGILLNIDTDIPIFKI